MPDLSPGSAPADPKTPKMFKDTKLRNQEKGVLAIGVSVESSVTAKETKNTQGYWPQQ